MSGLTNVELKPCAHCLRPLFDGEVWLCANCALTWDEEAQAAEDDYNNSPRCGCPYCFCAERTVAGEACGSCAAGTHQG